MPRGDKSKYSDKQERKAEHIEESYEKKGVSKDEAEARAWATVNKQSGGGEKAGSGKAKSGTAKSADRKDSARRAVATKQGQSPNSGRASARRSRTGSTSLSDLTRDELVKKAAEQNIRGRSRMKKDELIRALS
ncbi:Rho termination factor N-terminal domain-containing protein [Pseudomonas oryzihabitans]|uniref:Rho termination factor N-terminal domain-containing protein n=1 Tax=Pseudomonas oryzihabitans TaxID=47885 RepID=UPI00214E733D|nr:Rho termination factor N-terminal domain-containing protein [Pseudomonas psychrotolerans]UUW69974.1 Rho termination factor N-terminal domain-containing protein [Pseudomonas psychrotolerans]